MCAALPARLEAPTRFAYLSGWRRGEVLGLLWRQVDLAGGVIRLEAAQSKNGTARLLPFASGSPLARLLDQWARLRRLDCPYVFHRDGRPLRYFYTAWRTACAAIGRPALLSHDLRRSAVRNMVRAGTVDRQVVALAEKRSA